MILVIQSFVFFIEDIINKQCCLKA